jgi:hypothetical protein
MIGSGDRSKGKKRTVENQRGLWSGRKAYLEILSNLTNETLEGELADEQLGRLLVTPNFTESDGTGPETMGLLHTTSCVLYVGLELGRHWQWQYGETHGCSLASRRLGSELLTGSLA